MRRQIFSIYLGLVKTSHDDPGVHVQVLKDVEHDEHPIPVHQHAYHPIDSLTLRALVGDNSVLWETFMGRDEVLDCIW